MKTLKTMSQNDLGLLVENCPKVKISDFLKKYRMRSKENLIKSELELQGINIDLEITKTCYGGTRFWFKCPLCQSRAGVLFIHPLNSKVGCRKCLNLEYRKRRYKGMIESS